MADDLGKEKTMSRFLLYAADNRFLGSVLATNEQDALERSPGAARAVAADAIDDHDYQQAA